MIKQYAANRNQTYTVNHYYSCYYYYYQYFEKMMKQSLIFREHLITIVYDLAVLALQFRVYHR